MAPELLASALVVSILAAAAVAWVHRSRAKSWFHDRAPMPDDEFARSFASPLEGRIGVSIRELLQPWVGFDVRLARAGDEFGADLLLDARDGLDSEEFLASIEKRWDVVVPRSEAVHLRTIADLAAAVARLRPQEA